MIAANANVKSAAQKVDRYELQVKQARQAFELAQTNFEAGAITNLDMLDAEISMATSRFLLTKARIDYALNFEKLRMALGENLYQGD